METKKWKLLTEPIQLDETSIIINKNNPILIPTYTLQSLDLMTQDYDVKQKIKERWLKASEKNPKLRPGLKFRLISYPKEVTSVASSRLAESYDEPEPVFGLDLGITDYGVFVATNGFNVFPSPNNTKIIFFTFHDSIRIKSSAPIPCFFAST